MTLDLAFLEKANDVVGRAATIEQLRDETHGLVKTLGFRFVTCVTVRIIGTVVFHVANFQTWPKGDVVQFDTQQLFRFDPVVARSHVETSPFFWSLSIYDPGEPNHAGMLAIRRRNNIDSGYCVPVPERVGGVAAGRTVLFLTGEGITPSEPLALVLRILAGFVVAKLALLQTPPPDEAISLYLETTGLLTARERVILSWIASGKSSWETARILGISEHTVNTHVERVVNKLHATNRTEAAVKAIIMNEAAVVWEKSTLSVAKTAGTPAFEILQDTSGAGMQIAGKRAEHPPEK